MPPEKDNNLKGKTVLFVNACPPKKKFVLKQAKKLGINVIVLHYKEVPWAKPYVDHWIFSDLNDYRATVQKVKEFKSQHPEIHIDGIVTFWDESTLLTSRLVDAFGTIGIPYSISSKVKNKFLFREFCTRHGIRTPRYKSIKGKKDIIKAAEEVGFPLVIKPLFGSSSAFVMKIDSQEELAEAFEYISANILTHEDAKEWDSLDVLVEEYIDGDEVDVDIIIQNGKIKFHSITDNRKTHEPFFVETGDSIPSMLPEKEQEEVLSLAEEVLEKLGVQNGIIHFEAKNTKTGPVPIEVNLRMGGDQVYSFIKTVWHVDLVENALKIACGIFIPKIPKPEEPYKYLTGEYYLPQYSGTLVNVRVDNKLSKNPNIEEVCFFKKIGDTVLTPPSGYEYLGWITASGDSAPDARDNLMEVAKCIDYDIAKFSSGSSIGKTTRKNGIGVSSISEDWIKKTAKIEKIRRLSIRNQRSLHVGLACNLFSDKNGPVEADLTAVGKIVEQTLVERGYKVTFFDFNKIEKAFRDLSTSDVDIVFNVCERINNSSLLEPHVAAMFDVLQIPYTGSSPFTLSLCIDKIRVKKLLAYHNIPTPRWDYAYSMDDEVRDDLRYPLIIKPANTDNSIGITNDSVVTNKKALKKQMEKIMLEIGRPVIIEEYIEGDEYDVSVLGSEDDDLRVLPLSRSIFDKLPAGYWHIYPFEAKWAQDPTYKAKIIVQRPPKNVSTKLLSLITEISLDTYNILDCHDYGRVEVRVDEDNNPYILELNPNPSIYKGDSVPAVAELTGMDYGDFLEEVLRLAIKRYKNKPPYYHLQSSPL